MERYSRIQQIQKAILKGFSTYHGVALPSAQRAGTDYQKATYAFIKAEELYEKYFMNCTELSSHRG